MHEIDDKTKQLYRLLEDASRRVKEWPDWKRSEDSRQERLRLDEEGKRVESEARESD